MADDLTNDFNTKLSPADEARFQTWAKAHGRQRDTADYDLRGAWKDNAQEASNGHLPDTWKKPNHPTFSSESRYSSKDRPGGRWTEGKNGKWQFEASAWNVRNLGADGLKRYFQKAEPDAQLTIPVQALMYAGGKKK